MMGGEVMLKEFPLAFFEQKGKGEMKFPLLKHAKHVLNQGSGAELSTGFATTGGEEQRRGERRPMAGPHAFDSLVSQMVSQTDGHYSNPTRATASHRALSAAQADHAPSRVACLLCQPSIGCQRPPRCCPLWTLASLQAHLGSESCRLVAWKEHVLTSAGGA